MLRKYKTQVNENMKYKSIVNEQLKIYIEL